MGGTYFRRKSKGVGSWDKTDIIGWQIIQCPRYPPPSSPHPPAPVMDISEASVRRFQRDYSFTPPIRLYRDNRLDRTPLSQPLQSETSLDRITHNVLPQRSLWRWRSTSTRATSRPHHLGRSFRICKLPFSIGPSERRALFILIHPRPSRVITATAPSTPLTAPFGPRHLFLGLRPCPIAPSRWIGREIGLFATR